MNVVVLDLGLSNIHSLSSALGYLGARHTVTADPACLDGATHAILPGVGAFDAAMAAIDHAGVRDALHHFVNERRMPLLGICLGMQLLFESSEEGELPGLALMRGRFLRLAAAAGSPWKVPHVGFSPVHGHEPTGLFAGLGAQPYFYFTHSYALSAPMAGANAALCEHTRPFVAAFQCGNICGVQFHPEKSQSAGLRLISNFLELER